MLLHFACFFAGGHPRWLPIKLQRHPSLEYVNARSLFGSFGWTALSIPSSISRESSSLRQGLRTLPRLDCFPATRQQARSAVFLAHVEVVFARSHWECGFENFG
jgi:hypothetical protein